MYKPPRNALNRALKFFLAFSHDFCSTMFWVVRKIGLGPLDLKSRPSPHCWVRRNSRESTNYHFGPVEGGRGLAASHSSKDPPSLAYWLLHLPNWSVCAGVVGVALSAKIYLSSSPVQKKLSSSPIRDSLLKTVEFPTWPPDCYWVDHSPPAKLQNPSSPLHPMTDKLGFSGCLEQSVFIPNPVVGQSTGVHNQSNDGLFRQMENEYVSMEARSHERAPCKISFTLSERPLTSFVRFVAEKDWQPGHPTWQYAILWLCQKKAKKKKKKKTSGMLSKDG